MDLQFKGKTAIVTGGGSNIGRAIALTLGREGANVVIADIDEGVGSKVAGEIEAGGGKATYVKTDVTSLESVGAMFQRATGQFGQIHVLVNNVGWDVPQFFLETDPAFWDKVIALNYRSDLNTLKTVVPHMIEKGYGRIVNIASDAGRVGEFREAVYAGCKAGVIALSKAVAREYGRHNITLNVVCPGVTIPGAQEAVSANSMWANQGGPDTFFTPEVLEKAKKNYALRRLGTSQDIANAVAFLASDAANYVTGQVLSVSGGYSMVG